MAMGGSTNALVHLIAMAGRAGIQLPLERFNEFSAKDRSSPTCALRATST